MAEIIYPFASNFSSPDNGLSNIYQSASIDLPITEEMLPWVKITPIVTSQGGEKIVSARAPKYPTFREYWELWGDDILLWQGNFYTGFPDWRVYYGESEEDIGDWNWYMLYWTQTNDDVSTYYDDRYLWRAKYTSVSPYTIRYYSKSQQRTIYVLMRSIASHYHSYFVRWHELWNFHDEYIYPSYPNEYPNSPYGTDFDEPIWWIQKRTAPYTKKIVLPNLYASWSEGKYSDEYIQERMRPYRYDTIRIRKNLPDMEYTISSPGWNNSWSYSKYFQKINDNKFRLSIYGNFLVKSESTKIAEYKYATLDEIYKVEETFASYSPNTRRYDARYILHSSISGETIKRVPTPSNPTMHTRFLVTIINPSNHKELQRYEI